jgi:multidrug efflux pump subunit AcrA (membrane-fusion protein)
MTTHAPQTGRRRRLTPLIVATLGVAGLALALVFPATPLRDRLTLAAGDSSDYTVTAGEFTARVPATGELQAASSLSISVPRVQTGGLTIFSLLKDGTIVKQGDTLVEFDGSELAQQLEEAGHAIEAALRELDASVLRGGADTAAIVVDHTIAGIELEKAHTQAPLDTEIFSRNQIREGELDVDLSRTRVTEYGGKVETARTIEALSRRILVFDRSKHEVRRGQLTESIQLLKVLAPRDGMVLVEKDLAGNSVAVGETRSPGFVLMTMPDTSSMKARVQVLEADAGMVKVGQPASVVVDSHPGRPFTATVERVDAIARPLEKDSPVKYFEVVLRVDGDAPGILKAGKLVHVEITTASHRNAITVPRIAVLEGAGTHAVWVVGPEGLERRAVQVAPGDHVRLLITSGLDAGAVIRLDPPRDSQ